jgi:hypothetical protein
MPSQKEMRIKMRADADEFVGITSSNQEDDDNSDVPE